MCLRFDSREISIEAGKKKKEKNLIYCGKFPSNKRTKNKCLKTGRLREKVCKTQ